MTITAAAIITLKKPPSYRIVKDGTLPVWSAFGMAGGDAMSITAFAELAETLDALHLDVGGALSIIGDLSINEWEGKDGTKRSGLKMVLSKAEPITAPLSRGAKP